MKRATTIIISLFVILSLVSLSGGFDNNANFKNPKNRAEGQREYTRDNASKPVGQGGYYGGHDTITTEGMMLKKEVHKSDPDGGEKFKTWADIDSLPSLRTGAHDEDTNKSLNWLLNDPPIGANGWGDFFQHFYNADTGEGLKGQFTSATTRAVDYFWEIFKKVGCRPGSVQNLSPGDKNKVYDYFGRILHLLQDMGNPSHTKNDIHVFDKPFEGYVNNNWSAIVNSDAFRSGVSPESYLGGNYGMSNLNTPALAPNKFMEDLAKISQNFPSEEQLYDWVFDPNSQRFIRKLNEERLRKNVGELVPEVIKYTAGYIDAIYDYMSKGALADPTGIGGVIGIDSDICNPPPQPPNPANDHPDDRFDVSDEFYWEREFKLTGTALTDFYLRNAIKKGKIGVWYKKRFMEIFIEGRTKYKDASQEIKDAIETEFQATGRKLEERRGQAESDWKGAPDVALFTNGFYNPATSLMLKIGEPVSFQKIDFNPEIVKDHPVLLVPSGGFYGLKNSSVVKALLDEYVKKGGTLVVFTQQHGYDWELLPAPINPETGERKPITGYGYQEDQSCQFNSVYMDTYHPILSSFSTSIANIGVDGYFSSYPDNSTVLLRRVSNGQPAMILYPYGNGYVIATTIYSDFALTHHQINQTEINFVQNIISWAKKPDSIIEIKPGETVNLNLDVTNFMNVDATSIKFTILDPSRKAVNNQTVSVSIPAGQSATIPVTYTTASTSTLGIYHIDYTLLDAMGNIIQPQAETDSGRFVVSNPPENDYKPKDLLYSINTPREKFMLGHPIPFTVTIWNNSNDDKRLKLYWDLSHLTASFLDEVTVTAHGTLSKNYSVIIPNYNTSVRLWMHFFEENGTAVRKQTFVNVYGESWPYVGSCSKGITIVHPSIDTAVKTDKPIYTKGEMVAINTSFRNRINTPWQTIAKIIITDPKNTVAFEESIAVVLSPNGTASFNSNYTLPQTSLIGTYTVKLEELNQGDFGLFLSAVKRFELPQSQISVSTNLPSVFSTGTNTIPFTISNTGKINVSSGILNISLKDPNGSIVYSESQPFSIAVGESRTIDVPISIPSLKLGNYVLTYSQSDETMTGNPTNIPIPNSIALSLSFDKPTYRAREIANLTVGLTNRGKFNLENISVTISSPDVNYTDTKTLSLGVNSSATSLNFPIPIPETISAGLHDVNVVPTLPGGDSVTRQVRFVVPESALSVKYQGTPTASAGDTLSVVVENTGGVDTHYDAYIYLFDQGGWVLDSKSAAGSIQAGAQGNITYTLPDQLLGGGYTLRVEVIDKKTSKITSKNISLSISGLNGELSVGTDKDIYFLNEATMTLSTIHNQGKPMVNGNLHLEIVCAESGSSPSEMPVSFHIFTEENYNWVKRGVLRFPSYFERQELPLPISPDQWGGASLSISHQGAQGFIDSLALKDSNGNLYSPSFVGIPDWRDYTSEALAEDGISADVSGQRFYVTWSNLPIGVSYSLVMTAMEDRVCGVMWETNRSIHQGAGVTETIHIPAGVLGQAGKYYLKGELSNPLGQSLGTSFYPFYIIDGDTVLLFNTDKRIYKVGETVTITGRIENRAPITAENLVLTLNSSPGGQNPQLLLTETIHLLSGGIYPFTLTTTAGGEGIFTLSGSVKQNNEVLISIADQYEVASPLIATYVNIPQTTGNEPFIIEVDIWNEGKVDATVQIGIQSLEFDDSQTITVPPGKIKIIQYSQQITMDTTYTVTFTGDYEETITETVSYGFGASIQFGVGSPEFGVFPEGSVAIPFSIINTGQLAETLEISFTLSPGDLTQTKTYYLQPGSNITDTLYFDLTEGDYQITATSQRPDAFAQENFSVRKENQAQMSVSLGAQSGGLIPVNVNLTNVGFNEINGTVHLSLNTDSGQVVWSGEEALSQLSPQNSRLLIFNINPTAIDPGNYIVQVSLLSNSNQVIAGRSLEFGVQSAAFQITQLPPFQTFYPGQEASFAFSVKNTGDQEGSFELRFKSYDLMDTLQKEWLKPGEEKAVTFSFMLPEDLEEKNYFASYELKDSRGQGGEGSRGQIKYHLAGISLNVNAILDKANYSEGEAAHLTINIQSNNPNPQSLFARVNYNGYESQQTFTIGQGQAQPLPFDIPLPRITGEKLFYGVYHEGGRSIHLNSIYIYKTGDVITVTTDKQVYQPRDIVSVTVSGNASGSMTLSGPGGYEETFPFSNQVNKSFALPSTLTAGTYFIHVQLTTLTLNQVQGDIITVVHPFDVTGIQVKVLECQNDKGKYASTDTIRTSFTISSNTTMSALLKVWIVNPKNQYTLVGEQSINLSSSENSLITRHSSLTTAVSGIHRLVYGIYGPEDLLLCSGSEAFDVGDALLLGLSTDKRDYSTNTEPVIVTASLLGSVNTELQLEMDGAVIRTETISLNGFTSYTTQLQNITPGPHTLKAILTAGRIDPTTGSLKSIKETSFTYALSFMPKPQLSASPAYLDFGDINLRSTSTHTITLSSTGNADLMIGTIALSGANQGEFSIQSDDCSGRTITPSGTCTLNILLSPTSLGAKSASLSIFSNANQMPALYLPLSGAGVTTLNISINPVGSGRVTGRGMNCPPDCTESFTTSGATIQLTAIPIEGYQFSSWTGDNDLTENPMTVNMDTHRNMAANFALKTHTIIAIASTGGAIAPSGPVAVNHGANQTFMITSNPGYHVAEVKVDEITVGTVLSYTFDNVTSNRMIEAIFAVNQYTIIATAGPNGAISPSGTITLNDGESQTFDITPDSQYSVADVKVDGISVGAVTTFRFNNIIANHSIEATFEVENSPPVADAGPDQNVITGQLVTLNGSESYDPEGAMITFHWTFVKIPEGSSLTDASLSDINSAKPQFRPDVNGMHLLRLIVNDGTLDSLPDEVVINAATPNVPPNANAGPDQNVYTGSTVQLDGSKSNDPDNGPLPLSYLWRFVTKPSGSLLTDNAIANRTAPSASFVPDVAGLYELRLIVNDGHFSSEDTVKTMATAPNVPPNANAGADRTIYLGNAAVLDGSASNDPDQGPQLLTFLWSFVAVPAGSQLTNGALSGANTVSPSFTPDVTGTYVLQLMVFDGIDAGFDNVAVTVQVDIIAPTLAPVANLTTLWPPNHKMVDIIIWANASDNAGSPVALIAAVSSNEPQDGLGDGDTSPDWTEPVIDQINGIITLKLRAERSGRGQGRIYTITIIATDASGNSSQAKVEIRVPHDRRKK